MKLATVTTLLSCIMGMTQAETVPIQSIVDEMNGENHTDHNDHEGHEGDGHEEVVPPEAAPGDARDSSASGSFNRIATFFVCSQLDPDCNVDDETSAETIWVTKDFNTLVYTDSPGERLGLIDITDASTPEAMGFVDLPGEPTTVRIHGDYAVVGVNTSPDYVNPSGLLAVIDINSKSIIHEIDLGGQPDAVDVSKDEQYIVIAIENERDEDLGDGVLPQMPPGFVVIIDTPSSDPADWTSRQINMTGLDILYPEDPEPEYVSINEDNVAVITLQENNGIALIDLASGEVTSSFNAGEVLVDQIDTVEDSVIMQTDSSSLLREPDGVAWIGTEFYATANEGDMDGGSRGFTIFSASDDSIVYDSGNEMEHMAARLGHYPDERSENKGNEPENVLYSEYNDGSKYLFVLSERSSLIFVYDVADPTSPSLLQILPCTKAPEGVVAIPERNLLAVASEEDARDDKIRASVAIYELSNMDPIFPSIVSESRDDGTYIPFAALSGLSSTAGNNDMLYTIEDSFFKQNRVLAIDTSSYPATIVSEMRITDSDEVMKACLEAAGADASSMINEDMTVNIDPEGISAFDGGFWIVSEGAGTVGDEDRPYESPNMLLKLDEEALINECITLPPDFPTQVRFGFEGVAHDGDYIAIAIQRAWGDEEYPRIAFYNQETDEWKYIFYPLDDVESQYGGWVGLSDITNVGEGEYLVLERDNQGGPDAAIKRIYHIDVGVYAFSDGTVIKKELVKDLMDDLKKGNGSVIEKVEGMAVTSNGDIWINSDNDGVDDNSGEQFLMKVGEYEMPEDEGSSGSVLTIGFSFLATILLMAL